MKLALFTDIHWGAKGNSIQHNQDCSDYIDWFIDVVRQRQCDGIVFMGDWFENRNAINVQTLNYSFRGLKKLDELQLPIYFCVGNHDLYHRSNRKEYSTHHFEQFTNVKLVNEALVDGDMMFFPFLFEAEYPAAAAAITRAGAKYVFGHFEFRDFVVTGSDRKMDHGPDHKQFSSPSYIFSGHFHKRQINDNVIYIGNTFPTNYSDAWDDARGCAVVDTVSEDIAFYDWADCPKYRKIRLSDMLADGSTTFPEKCRVRCIIDTEIAYSEAQSIKEEMIRSMNLREFSLEENLVGKKELLEGDAEQLEFELVNLNDAVITMLSTKVPATGNIDPTRLVNIYEQL